MDDERDETAERPARPSWWRRALAIALTLAVVALLVRQAGGGAPFLGAVARARPEWVLAAFAAAGACVVLGAIRWQLVLGGMGHPLGFRRSLFAMLAVWPLVVVTPSRANELLRPLCVRDVVPLGAGVGSVLAEKAVDLGVLLALAALGVAVASLWPLALGIALALALEGAVVVVAVRRRAWLRSAPLLRRRPETVDELAHAFTALGRAPARLAAVVVVSAAIRVLTVAVTHALLRAVGADVALVSTVTLWPAAMLVGLVPVTLGGVGTRDAAFLAMLAATGAASGGAAARVDASSVLAATMGYSVVAVWSFAIVGVPFMLAALRALRSQPAPPR